VFCIVSGELKARSYKNGTIAIVPYGRRTVQTLHRSL